MTTHEQLRIMHWSMCYATSYVIDRANDDLQEFDKRWPAPENEKGGDVQMPLREDNLSRPESSSEPVGAKSQCKEKLHWLNGESLRCEFIDGHKGSHRAGGHYWTNAEDKKNTTEQVASAPVSQFGWRRPNADLPEDLKHFLVFCNTDKCSRIVYFTRGKCYIAYTDNELEYPISFWSPIPEPPTKGEE